MLKVSLSDRVLIIIFRLRDGMEGNEATHHEGGAEAMEALVDGGASPTDHLAAGGRRRHHRESER